MKDKLNLTQRKGPRISISNRDHNSISNKEKLNLHGTKPERVHINGEVYYFFFQYDGLRRDDYEPAVIEEDKNHRIVLSRFHWDLITAWTEPVLLNNKEKITFVTEWHTPIIHCKNYDRYLGIVEHGDFAQDVSNKYKSLGLSSAFIIVLSLVDIDSVFGGQPITFSDVITEEPVKEKYIFSMSRMCGILVMGSMSNLPGQVEDKLSELSVRFGSNYEFRE